MEQSSSFRRPALCLLTVVLALCVIFFLCSLPRSRLSGTDAQLPLPHYASHRPTALTMRGRNDGFGAQLQAVLAVIATARRLGLPFVFSPIRVEDHDTDPRTTDLLLARFANEYPALPQHALIEVNLLNDDPNFLGVYPEIFDVAHSILWEETPENGYTHALLEHTRVFLLHSASTSLSLSTLASTDIAVHIRRGDVQSQTMLGKSRYVPMSFYEQLVPLLILKYPAHSVRIFSEGDPSEFQGLTAAGPAVSLHLDEPTHVAFVHLMTAGVLVTSRSSFSYVAALLNAGHVYYFPFWHPSSPDWTDVEQLGLVATYW